MADNLVPLRANAGELERLLDRVYGEVLRMQRMNPTLAGEAPENLFCRYIVPETAPDFQSVLRRAALAVLHLRAVDRAEQADPTSGDAA